jgi:hypothetical protein
MGLLQGTHLTCPAPLLQAMPPSSPPQARTHSRSYTPITVLNLAQVRSGCHPDEIVQIRRCEYGQVRSSRSYLHATTAISCSSRPGLGPSTAHARPCLDRFPSRKLLLTNLWARVAFAPKTFADWGGTLVVKRVIPGRLHVFKRVLRQDERGGTHEEIKGAERYVTCGGRNEDGNPRVGSNRECAGEVLQRVSCRACLAISTNELESVVTVSSI